MAFEQLSSVAITPQADIWPFGLIAFYLMSGKNYWVTASTPEGGVHQLFAEILAMPLPPATERLRELGVEQAPWPEPFDAWLAQCIDRDPAERFATAGAAVRSLGQILSGDGALSATSLHQARKRIATYGFGSDDPRNQGPTGGIFPSNPPPGMAPSKPPPAAVPASTSGPAPRLEVVSSNASLSLTAAGVKNSNPLVALGIALGVVAAGAIAAALLFRAGSQSNSATPESVVQSSTLSPPSSTPSVASASASPAVSVVGEADSGTPASASAAPVASARSPVPPSRKPPTKKPPAGQDHLYGER
jgi:serine/threonine-protein kinase